MSTCVCGSFCSLGDSGPSLWVCPVHGKTGYMGFDVMFNAHREKLGFIDKNTFWDLCKGVLVTEYVRAKNQDRIYFAEDDLWTDVEKHIESLSATALPLEPVQVKMPGLFAGANIMSLLYFLVNLVSLITLGLWALVPEPTSLFWVASTIGSGASTLFALVLELRRPRPMIQGIGDSLRAVYLPKDVPPAGAEGLVGRLVLWTAMFKIDKGPHKGEWAMQAEDPQLPIWVPLTELVVQERRRGLLFKRW